MNQQVSNSFQQLSVDNQPQWLRPLTILWQDKQFNSIRYFGISGDIGWCNVHYRFLEQCGGHLYIDVKYKIYWKYEE